MTVIVLYSIPNFLDIILGILFVISYAFLFSGGRSLQRTRESYKHSDLFIKGGIISIILFFVRLCFPGLSGYNLTGEEVEFMLIVGFLLYIPEIIINVVIFGIFFIVIGFHNKKNYGYFLLSVGVLFILKTVLFLLIFFGSYYIDTIVLTIIGHFSSFLSISAMVTFLIYSILIREKFLSASGICLIATFLISIFYIYYL